jgi:sporulation protein YlmC with PRC-barrel domain
MRKIQTLAVIGIHQTLHLAVKLEVEEKRRVVVIMEAVMKVGAILVYPEVEERQKKVLITQDVQIRYLISNHLHLSKKKAK